MAVWSHQSSLVRMLYHRLLEGKPRPLNISMLSQVAGDCLAKCTPRQPSLGPALGCRFSVHLSNAQVPGTDLRVCSVTENLSLQPGIPSESTPNTTWGWSPVPSHGH